MKKLICLPLLALAFASCVQPKYVEYKYKCAIVTISPRFRYPGITPEKDYAIRTSCGLTFFVSSNRYQEGDTVDVTVRAYVK